MAATSQPIALPISSNHDPNSDIAMGSYSGTNGSFNPASYTRQYLGSPISWRAGSFGSRMHTGTSPGHLFGQFDPNDFKVGKLSSSIESDRGSIINALNVYDRQEDLCRNYSCCGLDLPDLHALVEHFEETHAFPPDAYAPVIPYPNPNTIQPPITYNTLSSNNLSTTPTQTEPHSIQSKPYFPEAQPPQHVYQSGPVDPEDMELDAIASSSHSTPSSGAPTPPDTPISTPLSSYPSSSLIYPYTSSQPPSPPSHSTSFESQVLSQFEGSVAAFDTTSIIPRPNGIPISKTHLSSAFTRASSRDSFSSAGSREMTPEMNATATYPFNAYAGYSDWSSRMPGTVPSPSKSAVDDAHNNSQSSGDEGSCVPPALLFSASTTPANTPSTSRVSSPSPSQQTKPSTTLSRPASTLLLSKPFKCPNSKCNKSYKQANGLKYHVTHGSCSLKPVREVEAVRVLLASKSSAANSANNSGQNSPNGSIPNSPNPNSPSSANVEREGDYGLTQEELIAIDKRVRPFACGVGECQRRYKNMNGLRYHYAHSGDHGKQGLEMLAKGIHECLVNGRQSGSRPSTPLPSQPQSTANFDSGREIPVQHTSQFQNATQITLRHVETHSADPLFHNQQSGNYVHAQPYHQIAYQPFQQQSYTLAGAMGGLGVYGQQKKVAADGRMGA